MFILFHSFDDSFQRITEFLEAAVLYINLDFIENQFGDLLDLHGIIKIAVSLVCSDGDLFGLACFHAQNAFIQSSDHFSFSDYETDAGALEHGPIRECSDIFYGCGIACMHFVGAIASEERK